MSLPFFIPEVLIPLNSCTFLSKYYKICSFQLNFSARSFFSFSNVEKKRKDDSHEVSPTEKNYLIIFEQKSAVI